MTIMGIDYGDRRTGVAFSDITGFIAGESFTITESSAQRLIEKIRALVLERKVSEIVLGCPKNMNATEGERAEKSRHFAELLEAELSLPVTLWDERLTSVDAHRILHMTGKKEKKHRKVVDAVAASLILQAYLDYRRMQQSK